MAKLLLELLSEEIPARMQAQAAQDLQRLLDHGLTAAGLPHAGTRGFAGPRRIAVVVDGLPRVRPATTEERRGPKKDAPAKAIEGFNRSNTAIVAKTLSMKPEDINIEQFTITRTTEGGEYLFFTLPKEGGPTEDVLPQILLDAIKAMSWPKSMKWGSGTFTWVRPLHSILAVFDSKPLVGQLELGGNMPPIRFGNRTRGHRFLSAGQITIDEVAGYIRQLRAARVILDPIERAAVIRAKVETLSIQSGVTVRHDEALIDEVAGLVEWPVPLVGTIDAAFMDLPPEVLVTAMRTHQRYFATLHQDGSLANKFVVVANMITSDGGTEIIAGNERVLRARLADARFFWDQDRKVKLADRLPALKGIVFHAQLGTQYERVERIAALAKEVVAQEKSGFFKDIDVAHVEQAARLCKADLVSGMVGEFPELQGTMGRYYALHEGLPASIADAIAEHYAPQGPNDACPKAPVSVAVALADKLDMLVSFGVIGERTTGSKDPFGLRRATLGIIRLISDNNLRLDYPLLVKDAHIERTNQLVEWVSSTESSVAQDTKKYLLSVSSDVIKPPVIFQNIQTGEDIWQFYLNHSGPQHHASLTAASNTSFIADRVVFYARDKGQRHDVIAAAMSRDKEQIPRMLKLAHAVEQFLATEDGRNLLTAYNRAANIVRAEEKKDKTLTAKIAGEVDEQLLQAEEEKVVTAALAAVDARAGPALEQEDFTAAMTALAELRDPIDVFFDRVTVNVDDPPLRLNRLKLLNRIRATIDRVADFSKIEG